MIKYPASIDSTIELPYIVDNSTPVKGDIINNLRDAVVALETELGIKPSGIYANVRTRLNAIESIVNDLQLGIVTFGGDLSSIDSVTQKVTGLQGRSISSATPSVNQTYIWSGTEWAPGDVSSVTSVQDGYNYGKTLIIVGFANTTNTDSSVFTNAATFRLDPTILTSANGTRTIKMRVLSNTTGPLMTMQLYNLTDALVVPNTTLTTSSTIPDEQITVDLSGDFTSGPAIYQLQIKMAAGSPSDRVILEYAVLEVEWS